MDDEIVADFLVESYEGLDRLENGLVVLEETPDDTATLTEVFRTLHTIKGTCGFLGFDALETIAHRGENLLSLLRDDVLEMDEEITDALLATNDAIRAILAQIEATGEEGEHDNTALVARLESLSRRADHVPDEPAAAAGAASEEDVEASEDADPAADDDATSDDDAVDDAAADEDGSDDEEQDAPPARIGDLLVEDGHADRTDVEVAAAEQQLGDDRPLGSILVDQGRAERQHVESAAARQRSAADARIRVDVDVLDTLMNLVGELVLTRNQIVQLTDAERGSDLAAPAQRLNLITSELQEGVMRTRMQPIGNVWNKLPRVVRDLAQQFDKQIRLEMEGKDTELDRTILEAIKDPLTHMVRNTADHGIESPDARAAAGKDPEGVLRLSASHEGGQVHIEIADDGGGIDAEVMRRKAVERGLLSADEAAGLSDNEAVRLIFRPGFSTAAKVTNVSGRGVGMDVVRSSIEQIGGSVDIRTEVGRGTSFVIKIPLTLAIIPAIVILCDGQRYAIPQLSLQELVRLDESQRIEDVHGTPVYRLRDRLLPIVDLRQQLGAPPADAEDNANIVVLALDGHRFGLIVDAILDTEEIVIKPLGRAVKDIGLFAGATVMGDGSVALILDVMGLADVSNVLSADVRGDDAGSDAGNVADVLDDRTVLLLDLGEGERVGILLDDVERLEEFDRERLEVSDGRDVVQYRGGIMPLVDLAAAAGRGSARISDLEHVSAVVCSVGGVTVGLAVRRIVDIAFGPEVHRDADGRIETAIVDGRVVDVLAVGDVVGHLVPAAAAARPVAMGV